jgi:hypothetical protein
MKYLRCLTIATLISFTIVVLSTGPAHGKSYWLRGALIGMGVGAAIGAGSVAAVCSIPEGSCKNKAAGYAGFTLLGAGAGFGIGAAIGSAFKKDESDKKVDEDQQSGLISPNIIIDPKSGIYGAAVGVSF